MPDNIQTSGLHLFFSSGTKLVTFLHALLNIDGTCHAFFDTALYHRDAKPSVWAQESIAASMPAAFKWTHDVLQEQRNVV